MKMRDERTPSSLFVSACHKDTQIEQSITMNSHTTYLKNCEKRKIV